MENVSVQRSTSLQPIQQIEELVKQIDFGLKQLDTLKIIGKTPITAFKQQADTVLRLEGDLLAIISAQLMPPEDEESLRDSCELTICESDFEDDQNTKRLKVENAAISTEIETLFETAKKQQGILRQKMICFNPEREGTGRAEISSTMPLHWKEQLLPLVKKVFPAFKLPSAATPSKKRRKVSTEKTNPVVSVDIGKTWTEVEAAKLDASVTALRIMEPGNAGYFALIHASMNCPNLRYLEVRQGLRLEAIATVIRGGKELKMLALTNIAASIPLGKAEMTDMLSGASGLLSLCICECPSFTPDAIPAISQACPNLQELSIGGREQPTDACMTALAESSIPTIKIPTQILATPLGQELATNFSLAILTKRRPNKRERPEIPAEDMTT